MSKSNKKYEDACFGHLCDVYKFTEDLHKRIDEIYGEWDSVKKRAFPFPKFLRQLGILPSTLTHWKTCRPTNLKLIEGVKAFCDETIFDSISDDKKLVLEYIKLIKPKNEVQDEGGEDKDKIPVDFLLDNEDKK